MEGVFKNKYRIESIRLKNWDYSNNGYYFVTICTKNREHYFGEIINAEMKLNEIGEIVRKYWYEIPKHFQNVSLDAFVVMPNHVHGIIVIEKKCIVERRDEALPRLYGGGFLEMSKISPMAGSLSVIVGSYKSICSKQIHLIDSYFNWQPRFYDHIIRDENALFNIRQYIQNNPSKWGTDRNNL